MPESKVLYLEDKLGSITPEVNRYTQVSGFAHKICYASSDMNKVATELLKISEQLGADRDPDEDGRKPAYTFPSETFAREELIKLAGLLRRLNFKLWNVSRAISRDAEDLAARVEIADDAQFSAELQKYLESDPSLDS